MRKYKIFLAKVGYENSNDSKVRPILVLKKIGNTIIARSITTKEPRNNYPGEYRVKDIKTAGLPKPSVIRMSKHLFVNSSDVYRQLGELSIEDAKNVEKLENTPYKESYNPDDVIDEFLYNYIK